MRASMIHLAFSLALLWAPAAQAQPAAAWEIGPVIRSRNLSVGMPAHPAPAGRGWTIDFPFPAARAGHLHYVTFEYGPLAGKRRILVRYRVEAAPNARFVALQRPDEPATISLVFQRRGDNWSGRGRYGSYRWYAPGAAVQPLAPGEHVMAVSLDGGWTNVNGVPAAADRDGFAEAIADTQRLGLVFGSSSARGHGVFATAPARVTLISFQVI
jgi:hypothetical protein